MNLKFVLLVFSFVLFVLAALPYPPAAPWWNRLVAAGLACWVATLVFF
jgi:hypothetical protein